MAIVKYQCNNKKQVNYKHISITISNKRIVNNTNIQLFINNIQMDNDNNNNLDIKHEIKCLLNN